MTEIVAVWRRTIAKAMHLTPRQSETFWPLYDAYQHELRDISEQRALWLQDIAGRQDLFSEETAGLMIQDYLDMENQRVALKRSTLKKFGQVLPARAVLKFIQLEIQIESGYYEDLGTNVPVSQ